jgi:hypothetical protein
VEAPYAPTEESFLRTWDWIYNEFSDKDDLLDYFLTSWLPVKYQWAQCYTNKYLNLNHNVTSQTEASNFNIKSYLLSGKCDWLRLAEALKELCENQARGYRQEVAHQQTSVKLNCLD